MFARVIVAAAAFGLLAGPALADTIEVKMLNKSEAGSMVFEPDYVVAKPGDTIRFISTDKGHNVEDIDGMLPEGAVEFKSKMSKDFELKVDVPGFYGIKCTPHYGMGMIGLIKVGEADNLDAVKAVKQSGKAKQRFADIFAKVD
jgi:pseudoazurin